MAIMAVLLMPSLASGAPSVTAVRIGEHERATRLVLDLSEPVSYRFFSLPGPDRLVIDLPEVAWLAPTELTDSGGLISRLRVGLNRPGTFRVVFDLREPARVRQSFAVPAVAGTGSRIVLDLDTDGGTGASEPATIQVAGPGWPLPRSGGGGIGQPPFEQPALAVLPPVTSPVPVPPPAGRARKPVIAIDAGHGGVDPGAISVSGTHEKQITLAMAKDLHRALEATGRYRPYLTRDRDIFIRLRDRIDLARKAGADLFISLHADASPNGREAKGLSVYTLSNEASDREAAALAAKENKADLIAGINLAAEAPEVVDILIDLAQRETMNLSAHFASFLIGDLANEVTLLRQTHRFAGFAVLKAPDIPSVLIELGYLTNPEEDRNLRSPAYRQRLSEAIVRATDRYFAQRGALLRS